MLTCPSSKGRTLDDPPFCQVDAMDTEDPPLEEILMIDGDDVNLVSSVLLREGEDLETSCEPLEGFLEAGRVADVPVRQ